MICTYYIFVLIENVTVSFHLISCVGQESARGGAEGEPPVLRQTPVHRGPGTPLQELLQSDRARALQRVRCPFTRRGGVGGVSCVQRSKQSKAFLRRLSAAFSV